MNASNGRQPGVLILSALWFGAAISLAEIETGALLAGMGAAKAMAANLAGHAVGALLFFLAAYISFSRKKTAIAVCESSFGRGGPVLFGFLNLAQLIGWTAVMIIVASVSLQAIWPQAADSLGFSLLSRLLPAALVVFQAVKGPRKIGVLNAVVSLLLGLLCVLLSVKVFSGDFLAAHPAADSFGFGTGFELAIIMPLSWLPLVGDYAADAKGGIKTALGAALAYFLSSVWMYSIGMAATISHGLTSPALILGGALLPVAVLIILLSTVTTAFLDLRSAAISLRTALPKLRESIALLIASALSVILALLAPMDRYQDFLLLIGSVFAPLYAVLLPDFLLSRFCKRPARPAVSFTVWGLGVIAYHSPLFSGELFAGFLPGKTMPVMLCTALIFTLYRVGENKWTR